ncbi:hypothetical protein [Euzebyella saccharophila]|uniref:Uncharacterized protein n=1 Tax=Euzebyella saccharophila TaxID=679664 RepID=A0ABV8JUZ3_9FLAO|nr:hypothetical protein [Euzebyella saccharophila]
MENDNTLHIGDQNISERFLRKKRSYISLRNWIGWAGGYPSNKDEKNKE